MKIYSNQNICRQKQFKFPSRKIYIRFIQPNMLGKLIYVKSSNYLFFKFRYNLYTINSINTQSISCILELYVTIINCLVINPSFNRVNFSSIFYLFTRSSFSILFSFYFFYIYFFAGCNIFLLAYEILTTSCYTSYI